MEDEALRHEFERLMALFNQGVEGKAMNLNEVFRESFTFFEHLKRKLVRGTPDEKKQIVEMMTEMYKKLIGEVKAVCEKTGLSEEQLMSFSDNPNNFSPEQWQAIQDAKSKMSDTGKDIAHLLVDNLNKLGQKVTAPEPKSATPAPKKPPQKGPGKKDWMKS